MRTAVRTSTLLLLALGLFSIPAYSSGQNYEGASVILYGKVLDSSDDRPLHSASVSLGSLNISNVSNSEGNFSLKLPSGVSPEEEVTVSFLGYLAASLRVGDFASATKERPLTIRLLPVRLTIDPATVRSTDPLDLLGAAYARVKDNYPSVPTGMTAFYRELIRRRGGRYLALSEAVLDINKAPYRSVRPDQAKIYKGRSSTDYRPADSLVIRFQGGVNSALNLDMVKNPFAGVWLSELKSCYLFSMEQPVMRDGESFYVIAFTQREDAEDILYSGRVYIESGSLAIGRVELSLDVAGREERAAGLLVLKQPAGIRFYVTKAEYVVNYRRHDGLWHYDYCEMRVDLSTRRRKTLFWNHYSIVGELAVTRHSDSLVRIGADERLRFKDILSEKVGDFRDDDFWGEYNVIEPDRTIDAIVRRIVRRLEGRR